MREHLAKVYAAELEGIHARPIEVEVDLNVGLHAFDIVGLADRALVEAKERVNSALKNSGFKPPNRENRKITVNLAPADIKKTGSQYDCAIAIGYLSATGQLLEKKLRDSLFLGELALDGTLRPVNGAISVALMAAENKFRYLFLPKANSAEAAVVRSIHVVPVESLKEIIGILEQEEYPKAESENIEDDSAQKSAVDISDIKGQEHAKRALIIAAAGGHNLLMVGPPGVGKSMLAQALVGILPRLNHEEAVEVTKIWSAAGLNNGGKLIIRRPFRSPHQTASPVSIIGGGSEPKPGEISLAHRGVLFLDELPEFQRSLLEAMRQPLESGVVHITRARGAIQIPARFTLIAAMNPCPCGYAGDEEKECHCSPFEVSRYQKKISGPLLDRIDIQVRVQRVDMQQLRDDKTKRSNSEQVRGNIDRVRAIQKQRFLEKGINAQTNSEISSRQIEETIKLAPSAEKFIDSWKQARLSPRSYYRLLKTARTIADLEDSPQVTPDHLSEAFSYRLREEVL